MKKKKALDKPQSKAVVPASNSGDRNDGAKTSKRNAASSLRRSRASISLTFGIVLVVGFISATSALFMHTGWRIFTNQEIDKLSDKISTDAIEIVGNFTELIFVDAVTIQNQVYSLIENDVIDIDDVSSIRTIYLSLLTANPGITWVSMGLPNGNFYGARRIDNDTIQWNESYFDSDSGVATRLRENIDIVDGLFVLDSTSTITNDYYSPQRSWYQSAAQASTRQNTWTDVYIFSTTQNPGVNSAIAYRDDGELKAVISIALELSDLSVRVAGADVSENGVAFIINSQKELIAFFEQSEVVLTDDDEDGVVIANNNIEFAQQSCNCEVYSDTVISVAGNTSLRTIDLSNDVRLQALSRSVNRDISLDYRDIVNRFVRESVNNSNSRAGLFQSSTVALTTPVAETYRVVVSPISSVGFQDSTTEALTAAFGDLGVDSLEWFVGTVIPQVDITGDIEVASRNLLVIVYGIILVNIVLVIIILRILLIKPIRQIAEQVEYVRQFDLDLVRLPNSYIREVGLLTQSLAQMNTGLSSFQKYLPTALVKRLIDRGLEAKLGGIEQEVTIFFCDIAGFTHITEIMRSSIVDHLDSYFTNLSDIIQSSSGTIDKYMGDAIMAFWGAPIPQSDHAILACQAAIRCNQTLARLRLDWKARGKEELFVRFGLNSGKVLVGNFGSHFRMNYTAIGDSVNVAARLEALNKIYGTELLIGHSTKELIGEKFIVRHVDKVAVYGRAESIEIYELLGIRDNDYHPDSYKWIRYYEEGLRLYREKEWKDAIDQFLMAHREREGEDNLSLLFVNRCRHLATQNVPSTWDGTFVLESK